MADPRYYPTLARPNYETDPQYLELANTMLARLAREREQQQPQPVFEPPPPAPQQGFFPGLYHGIQKGFSVEAPEMFGRALQAFGAEDTGRSLVAGAEQRAQAPEYQNLGPWGEAAASVVPVAGGLLAAPLLGAAGVPAGIAGAAGMAGMGALFGGAQYTETKEKGGSTAQALGTGAVQGVANIALGHIGGKLVAGTLGKLSAQGALNSFSLERAPSLVGALGKNYLQLQAAQVPTQAAASAAVAGIEQGLPNTPSAWDAAKQSVLPTLMMNTLLAPLGVFGTAGNLRQRKVVGAMVTEPPPVEQMSPADLDAARKNRLSALSVVYREMKQADPERAEAWRMEANAAILADQPVRLDADFKYEIAQPPPPEEPQQPEQPQARLPYTELGRDHPTYDVEREQARQQAVDTVESMWAARDAEEQRRTGAMEAAGVHRGGIDVTEMGPLQQIDLREPRGIADLPSAGTIDIKSPEQYETTAREGRVKWLQSILGSKASAVANKLAGMPSEELAKAVQGLWVQKGGEAATVSYAPRLEILYERLTGRNIREGLDEATTKEPAGTKPEPTADAARPEAAAAVEDAARPAGDAVAVAEQAAPAAEVKPPTTPPATPIPRVELAPKVYPKDPAPIAKARELLTDTRVPTFTTMPIRGVAKTLGVEIGAKDTPARVMEKIQQAVDEHDIRTTGETRPRAGEVPHGEATRDISMVPQGDLYATGTRQVEGSGEQEHPRTGALGEGEGVNRQQPGAERGAGAEDGGSNLLAEGGQVEPRNAPAEGEPVRQTAAERKQEAAVQEAVAERQRQSLALDSTEETRVRIETDLHNTRRAISQLNHQLVAKPSQREIEAAVDRVNALSSDDPQYAQRARERDRLLERQSKWQEQQRQKEMLKDHEQELLKLRDERVKAYSDAVGREEKLTSGPEPAADPRYYTFISRPWNKYKSVMGNITLLRPFMEALRMTGRGELVKNLISMRGYKPQPKAERVARDALNRLSPAEMDRYLERVKEYGRLMAKLDEWKISRNRVERAIREQALTDVPYEHRINVIDEMMRNGEITPEEAAQHRTAALNAQEVEQAKQDVQKRGLAGLNEERMGEVVRQTPTAAAALAHIAKTHANPLVRTVARILGRRQSLTRIQVVENPDFNGGYYDPATDTAYLGRGGVNSVTVMHEVTHAETHVALDNAIMNEGKSNLSKQQMAEVEALREIRRIQAKFSEMANLDDPAHRLALENEHEFVSEALNNPEIQQLLSKGNWLTKLYNHIAKAFGFDQKLTGDFAKLMGAATDLFGEARDRGHDIFGSFISRDAFTGRPEDGPWGAQQMTRIAHNQLASISPKLRGYMTEKQISHEVQKTLLGFATLNDTTDMLKITLDKLERRFPGTAQAIAPIAKTFEGFRRAVDAKRGMEAFLSKEAQDIQYRKLAFQKKHPALFDRTVTNATESSRGGIDPAATSYEQAKRRNPKLTEAEYNRPDARRWRQEYQQLQRESATIRAREGPDAITPMSIYHTDLSRNSTMNARMLLNVVKESLRLHDLPTTAEHSWENHRHDPRDYAKRSLDDQRNNIMKVVDKTMAGLTTAAKPYKDAQAYIKEAQKQLAKAGTPDERKALRTLIKDKTDAMNRMATEANASSALDAMTDAHGHYTAWQRVPYFHIGRTGDWFIKGTVSDVPGAWEQVGAVVDSLKRQWGPPVDGNRDMFMKFEDERQHVKAVEALTALRDAGLFKHAETGEDSWASGPAAEISKHNTQAMPQYINILKRRIAGSDRTEQEKQGILRDLTDVWMQQAPETAAMKAEMFRDGDVGYSKDFIETAGSRATVANNALARFSTSPLIGTTLADLDKLMRGLNRQTAPPGMSAGELEHFKGTVQNYLGELRKRVDLMNTPTHSPTLDRARAVTALWDLAVSPAYIITTLYQPAQITLPFLGGRFGYVAAATSMARNAAKAYAMINQSLKLGWATDRADAFTKLAKSSEISLEFAKLKNKDGSQLLSPQLLDVMDHLDWTGLLNYGQTNQLARLDPSDVSAFGKLTKMASVAPHYIEVSNRIISMLSAYELATTKGRMSHEDAKNFALQTVRDTDGDHSAANIARQLGRQGIARGATPMLVGFNQYNFQMLGLLLRTFAKAWGKGEEASVARKQLAGVAASTGMAAGTLGLPFVSAVAAVVNTLLSAFGDANDEPPDVLHAWRMQLDSTFGQKGGEIIARGLPRALDFDMSARVGFQDILPFSKFLADRRQLQDKVTDGALSVAGPTVGLINNMWQAKDAMVEGNVVKAIDKGLPAALRGGAKAYRIANYGYETEEGNNQIPIGMPTDWNVFMQAMGFTPAPKAEYSEQAFAFSTNQRLLQHRHQVINQNIYRAVEHGDYEALGKLFESNIDFMNRHPTMVSSPVGGLKQRAMERAVGEASGTGILTGKRQFPLLQDYQ